MRSDKVLNFNTPKRNIRSMCLYYGKFCANLKNTIRVEFLAKCPRTLHQIGHTLDLMAQKGAEVMLKGTYLERNFCL